MHNLTAFIRFHATERPDATAVIYEGQRISYAELLDRARAAASWFRGEGIGPGDIVALLMKRLWMSAER